ncbi:hypothetical protein MPSEU_001065200 [Mayamaea pseudoterrestris]|nr:hypothetical protein MPSEU_001065200 [Mayamaea pseudoterrestris]
MPSSSDENSFTETRKPSMTEPALLATANDSPTAADSRFSCNICFEAVSEPVVTQCGHLYCWPCMYRWLEPGMRNDERISLGLTASTNMNTWISTNASTESRRVCPVCKANCCVTGLVPIYVRNETEDVQSVPVPVNTRVHSHLFEQGVLAETSIPTAPMTPPQAIRRRFVSTAGDLAIEGSDPGNSGAPVPARPMANSPQRNRSDGSNTNHHRTPVHHQQQHYLVHQRESPNRSPSSVYLGSLTRGMALMIQQQQQQLLLSNPLAAPSSSDARQQPLVPPLQRLMDQHGNFRTTLVQSAGNAAAGTGSNAHADDLDETDVLSRLLLMLGSFVILCLLIF